MSNQPEAESLLAGESEQALQPGLTLSIPPSTLSLPLFPWTISPLPRQRWSSRLPMPPGVSRG